MYKINQFQPCLYALILTGMVGYGLASGSMGMWGIGCGGVVINWWLLRTGRFRSLPRIVANLLTVFAMIYVGRQLISAGSSAVLVIGQFLVVLQLVKLWEQRANRDYGQLLILSLLLMVAASINTGSLLFGLLFVVYLFLSLYCCLLFHLKVETDTARAASGSNVANAGPRDPDILEYANRQDERHLSRSMRRLTGIMSVVAIAAAVLVFLLFPRGAGQSMLVPIQGQAQAVLTGFSEEVKFDTVARITQNDEVVGYLEVWKHDDAGETKVVNQEEQLLRGVTLDSYHPDGPRGEWDRSFSDDTPTTYQPNAPWQLHPGLSTPPVYWRQKIQLKPTGTRTFFALAGAFQLTPHHELRIRYSGDGALQSDEILGSLAEYEVLSTRDLGDAPPASPHPQSVDPAIAAYALRPEVCGTDPQGQSLGLLRRASPIGQPSTLDAQIADNIQRHLHGPGFSYTLDITDSKSRNNQDPYVWFLSPQGHRGHCEYFAGAMVLMCQSLGLDARMVVGFRCNDYTTLGDGYYIIRQSQAHAWVEVRTTDGWKEYDPTSGREAGEQSRGHLAKWWQSVRHFFDFLEYTYAENVVAYDNDNRANLIQTVERGMTSTAFHSESRIRDLENWLNRCWTASTLSDYADRFGGPIGATILVLAIIAVACLTARWALQRARLRRRAARIGIDSLPSDEQLRLARQLGFYDDLVRLLARHRLWRRPHQTPLEFSRSLFVLPSEAYDTVRRLTAVYYRVRYGSAMLSAGRQRSLANVIQRLEKGLTDELNEPT
jgi:transglutaminase-like putative cysteine protease